ncbi:septal ring lytic transglycosylase RlpA family protein [Pigmentiphaga aceris]|nr:septal ring lytic transglycosylase RlpA family protein [Pigmentiphaga aceris]
MLAVSLLIAGCGSSPKRDSSTASSSGGGSSRGGGYYKDDGPPDRPPSDLELVPDAMPAVEPLASGPNRPYNVFGKNYTPDTSGRPYRVQGLASWYGKKFHGQKTSNGDTYDMYGMSAAHTTLPIPSYVRVTRVSTGKTVLLRVNDRGPFHSDRIIDLSYTAAVKLGILGAGSAEVVVEHLTPTEIARIRAERAGEQTEYASRAPATVAMLEASAAASTVAPAPAYINTPAPSTGFGSQDSLPADTIAATAPIAFGAAPSQIEALPPPAPMAPRPVPAAQPAYPSASAASAGLSAPSTAAAPVLDGVYLQLGAFSGQQNAQDLLGRLRSQLTDWAEPLRIVLVGNLHRVRIGPYADRVTAQLAANRLQQRVNMTAMIVTQ